MQYKRIEKTNMKKKLDIPTSIPMKDRKIHLIITE